MFQFIYIASVILRSVRSARSARYVTTNL